MDVAAPVESGEVEWSGAEEELTLACLHDNPALVEFLAFCIMPVRNGWMENR